MSDIEERELERKASEGDAEAAAKLSKAKARRSPDPVPYGDEPGSRYVTDDDEANDAVENGHKVTMRLEKGDVVRVEPADGAKFAPWLGLYLEQKWDSAGVGRPFVQPFDLLQGSGRTLASQEPLVVRDAKVFVLRRRGRRL